MATRQKERSIRGFTRDDIERDWVTKDKQSIISWGLRLFDACEERRIAFETRDQQYNNLLDQYRDLMKEYKVLRDSTRSWLGRFLDNLLVRRADKHQGEPKE